MALPDVARGRLDSAIAVAHPPDRPSRLVAGGDNAVAYTLSLIGDEWTLGILRRATQGARRYGDWLETMAISNSVLTARLSRLTDMGMMSRVEYQHRPQRFEYRLTKRGKEVWPVLAAIWGWERSWSGPRDVPLPTIIHRRCGSDFVSYMRCAACQQAVDAHDVEGGFGPSGSFARSIPAPTTRRRSEEAQTRAPTVVPETMALLGNRWSAAMIGAAFQGARRFSEFETRTGAPPTMVADRLRRFRELGVFATPTDPGSPPYHLTDKGRAFYPVVMLAIDWGQRWFRAPEGPALLYRHRACGRSFRPQLACGHCDEVPQINDVFVQGAV